MKKIKKCFVIMPISNHSDYKDNHFTLVYEDIIKKSIEEANKTLDYNLEPIRADDRKGTQLIQAEIIKNCIEADFAICDISSRNPNVMFELGIRQAFSKPTLIIKDKITKNIFDINGLRYTTYDESMGYRSVLEDIQNISKALIDTLNPKEKDINTLMKLININTSPDTLKELSKDEVVSFLDQTINKLIDKVSTIEQKVGDSPKQQHIDNIITVLFPNNRKLVLNYENYLTVQDLLDYIWEDLNFVFGYELKAFTYGKTWRLINLSTKEVLEKNSNTFSARDNRSLLEVGVDIGSILEVEIL